MAERLYCPAMPCLPRDLAGWPREVNEVLVRMSASFADEEAYLRHMEREHFIAPRNAPKPYRLDDEKEVEG